jgi:hypothetical protein
LILPELTERRSLHPDEVDLDDSTYLIPCFSDTTLLEKSVARLGIINTPVLQEKSGRLVPVLGRRRIKAAKSTGMKDTPALLLPSDIPVQDGFLLAFWDNVAIRRLDAAVVSTLVKRILELFPIEFAVDELFPCLGVPPSGPRIERLRRIGGMESHIHAALSAGKLLEKTAFLLTGISESERSTLFEFAVGLGYNANKAAEVIENMLDISVRLETPIAEIISRPDIRAIIAEDTDAPKKAERVRAYLNQLKNPDLVEKIRQFEAWNAEFRLRKNVSIRHSPAFEHPNYRLEIQGSKEDIEHILKRLSLMEL